MLGNYELGGFQLPADNLDKNADAVTSYTHFCEETIIPTRTRVCYNNNQPWLDPAGKGSVQEWRQRPHSEGSFIEGSYPHPHTTAFVSVTKKGN